MDNPQKELMPYVRNSLQSHEEPYMEGAWEDFNRKKKRLLLPYFWITGTAAILVIGLSLFLLPKENSAPFVKSEQVKRRNNQAEDKPELMFKKETDLHTGSHSIAQQKSFTTPVITPENMDVFKIEKSVSTGYAEVKSDHTIPDRRSRENKIAIQDTATSLIATVIPLKKDTGTKPEVNFWDTGPNKDPAPGKEVKKWGFAVLLSSAASNKKNNLTAGVQVGYELTDKLMISSGLSVAELDATRKLNPAPGNQARQLRSVDTRLTGLEIPVEFKYTISKHLYSSIGITSFAVLNENRNNNYLEEKELTESVLLVSGQTVTKTTIIRQKLTEKIDNSQFNNTAYVGFYLLSVGYQSKFLKKNTIAIEPFLKIPVARFTDNNMRLGNGGLRLKFGF